MMTINHGRALYPFEPIALEPMLHEHPRISLTISIVVGELMVQMKLSRGKQNETMILIQSEAGSE